MTASLPHPIDIRRQLNKTLKIKKQILKTNKQTNLATRLKYSTQMSFKTKT